MSEEQKRVQIVEDHDNGEDINEIARRSGYHVKSCQRIIRRFAKKKSMKREKGAGRPQILGPSDKIAIVNFIRAHLWLGAAKMKIRLNLKAQPRTIRQYLNELH